MYLAVGTRCLCAELVAGEVKHFKTLIVILLVKLFKTLILRSKAAARGGIHYQHYLAFELAQRKLTAISLRNFQIIDRHNDTLLMNFRLFYLCHTKYFVYKLIVSN